MSCWTQVRMSGNHWKRPFPMIKWQLWRLAARKVRHEHCSNFYQPHAMQSEVTVVWRLHPCENCEALVLSAAPAHWTCCAVHRRALIGWRPSPLALVMGLRSGRDAGSIWVHTGCHFFKRLYSSSVDLHSVGDNTPPLFSLFLSSSFSPCIAQTAFSFDVLSNFNRLKSFIGFFSKNASKTLHESFFIFFLNFRDN